MTLNLLWLGSELTGLEIQASGAEVASDNSGDQNLSALLGEVNVVAEKFGVLVDVTVQGGTQASVDFDLEMKIATKYVTVGTFNTVPGDGVIQRLLMPGGGTTPEMIGDVRWLPITDQYRVAWVFNTPGATPTITFSLQAIGAGFRNSRLGWPGMRI